MATENEKVPDRDQQPSRTPQRQDSLRSQLRDVQTKANEMGCYDAADFIAKILEK